MFSPWKGAFTCVVVAAWAVSCGLVVVGLAWLMWMLLVLWSHDGPKLP